MGSLARDSIREEVKSLVRNLRQSWQPGSIPYDFCLYHYTDANGLLGILTNKAFWATDINFLNDATELKYAADLINAILDAKLKENVGGSIERFWDFTKTILYLHPGTMNGYVTCFCENGNLLSQWRAYGASGAGYSIGVCAGSLKGVERDDPGALIYETRLRKVIYDKEAQEQLVTETINQFSTLLGRILGEITDEGYKESILQEFANYLAAELSEYLYCFKSSVFQEEQEWRVIHTATNYRAYDEKNDALKFRASGGNIIPYIELPFASPPTGFIVARGYPLRSITFGPSLHPKLTERSLYVLLDSAFGGGTGIMVSSSDIPLRSSK